MTTPAPTPTATATITANPSASPTATATEPVSVVATPGPEPVTADQFQQLQDALGSYFGIGVFIGGLTLFLLCVVAVMAIRK